MSDRARVLNCLRLAGNSGVHSLDLRRNGITGNPSERIRELRALGFTIEAIPERQNGRNGRRYVLHAEPADAAGGAGESNPIRFSAGPARGAGVGAAVHSQAASPQAYRGDRTDSGAPPPTPAPDSPGAGAGTLFPPPAERPRSAALHDYEDEAG